jgi:predicted NBD/HSP70 family sugar kinase
VRLGIDVGGTKIEGVCLDGEGRELARERIATPHGAFAEVLEAIAHLVEELERTANEKAGRIGVGTPGFLAPDGAIRNSNLQSLNGRALDRDLASRLGRPVRVANDANCFVLSETLDGAATREGQPLEAQAHQADVVFGATLGTGVGGGLVISSRVWPGANGSAGEWSHLSLPYLRPEDGLGSGCYCGRPACIESFLCGRGLEWEHRRTRGETLSSKEIARRAAEGDPPAVVTFATFEDRLARALALVVDLVDPRAIVLGGGIANNPRLFENVPPAMERYTVARGLATRLVAARHGDASGVRGAARLWD